MFRHFRPHNSNFSTSQNRIVSQKCEQFSYRGFLVLNGPLTSLKHPSEGYKVAEASLGRLVVALLFFWLCAPRTRSRLVHCPVSDPWGKCSYLALKTHHDDIYLYMYEYINIWILYIYIYTYICMYIYNPEPWLEILYVSSWILILSNTNLFDH